MKRKNKKVKTDSAGRYRTGWWIDADLLHDIRVLADVEFAGVGGKMTLMASRLLREAVEKRKEQSQ